MFRTFSFSKWSDFQKCRLRAKALHIDKVPRESSEALERGIRVHDQAEKYLRTGERGEELTDWFVEQLDTLKPYEPALHLEELWGADLLHMPSKHGPVWLKIDACAFIAPSEALVVDYKTGKKEGREVEHALQGQLYALCALQRFPELETVQVEFWYVDHDVIGPAKMYSRKDVPDLVRQWKDRWDQMAKEQDYPEKPGWYCGWCPIATEDLCPSGADYVKNRKWRSKR